MYINDPFVLGWIQLLGSFTMFPLLIRDGLSIPYISINIFYIIILSFINDFIPKLSSANPKINYHGNGFSRLKNIFYQLRTIFISFSIAGDSFIKTI